MDGSETAQAATALHTDLKAECERLLSDFQACLHRPTSGHVTNYRLAAAVALDKHTAICQFYGDAALSDQRMEWVLRGIDTNSTRGSETYNDQGHVGGYHSDEPQRRHQQARRAYARPSTSGLALSLQFDVGPAGSAEAHANDRK